MPEETQPTKEALISELVNQMMIEKGADRADLAEKARLEQELNARVDESIVDALSDEQLMYLDQQLDAGMSDEDLESFFANSGIDFSTVVQNEVGAFRAAYLGGQNG